MNETQTGDPFPEKTVEDYLKYDLGGLERRRFMANLCIQAAQEGIAEGHPDGKRALAYYREQRRLINQARYVHLYGQEGPPEQVIRMKPASLAGVAVDTKEKKQRPVITMEELLNQFQIGGK